MNKDIDLIYSHSIDGTENELLLILPKYTRTCKKCQCHFQKHEFPILINRNNNFKRLLTS